MLQHRSEPPLNLVTRAHTLPEGLNKGLNHSNAAVAGQHIHPSIGQGTHPVGE